MVFWALIAFLFIGSFLWAALSLKKELSKPHEIEKAKKELKKEKILFKL